MTVAVKSRYGQMRYLHDDGKGEIWMTGNMEYTRMGGEPDNLMYADVDGGPWIGKGDNLKEYFQDNKDRIVERIEVGSIIKLFYKTDIV